MAGHAGTMVGEMEIGWQELAQIKWKKMYTLPS
jgi:hypothetical protein